MLGGTSTVTGKHQAVLLHRTRGATPLETIVRLFLLGVPVDEDQARTALAPLPLEWWAERGLLDVSSGNAQGTVQLLCYQGLVVAFDFQRRPGEVLRPDFVMGISPSSLTLAGLTVRRPNRTALDLGTGCGIQAFLSAQHSERVVATDKNPRAVALTAFNAALNELTYIDSREGDMFEPVEGETFDLITSNPPFVISPDNVYSFMHSGMTGDEVCRTIAREAPRFLNPGGFCQFMANWTVGIDEDWDDRLAGWFAGTGCSVWVLRRGAQSPDEYARIWIESEEGEEAFARSFAAWMDYYERLGIAAIDSGLITMRRGSGGPNWFRAEDSPETMVFPASNEILRTFEAEDFLAAHLDDEALLGARYSVAPDARLTQEFGPDGDSWDLVGTELRRTEGMNWSGAIDTAAANMLGRCDGTRPMAELLAALAAEAGEDLQAMSHWPGLIRRLVQCGFLRPVS